ncbi:MAG: hypothetical protein E6Q36_01050 [Chryseobacterium sp.]|nr:MAG: hypothetical protein E6Q36_01050 [Chryseobacterium sp.]
MNISIISFVVALVVITILVVMLMKQKAKPERKEYRTTSNDDTSQTQAFNTGLVQSKWAEVITMQNSGPSGLKNALIEADKLLDYCMIGKGFAGETMGDRLKSGGSQFSNLNAVWAAHKLRNQLAHEVEHDLVPEQIKHSIQAIGNAIRDLGISIQ